MKRAAVLLLGAALLAGIAVPAWAGSAVPTATSRSVVAYGTDHIEAMATEALAAKINRGRIRVELDNPAAELRVPQGSAAPSLERVYYNPINGRFAAEVVVATTGGPARLPITGSARGWVEIPVLNRRLAVGETIGEEDISLMETRVDLVDNDAVERPEDLVGLEVRRVVPINVAVHPRDVRSPRLVEKGAMVTIVLSTPRMVLTAQGRAQQDGGKGDVIRVTNTQSNRVVEVTVVGLNQVAAAKPGVAAF